MLISGGGILNFSETAKDSEFDVEYNRYLSSTSGKYTHIPLLCIHMVSVKVLFLIHIEDERFCNIYIYVIVETFCTEKNGKEIL